MQICLATDEGSEGMLLDQRLRQAVIASGGDERDPREADPIHEALSDHVFRRRGAGGVEEISAVKNGIHAAFHRALGHGHETALAIRRPDGSPVRAEDERPAGCGLFVDVVIPGAGETDHARA